jgi:hypothetical protein
VNILDVIKAAQGGEAVANMARTYGIDPAQVEAVLGKVVPDLTRAVARNTLNRQGTAEVVRELGRQDTQAALKPGASLNSPDIIAAGNDILGNLLGSKHQSRGLADRTARDTGVSADLIRKMLPAIAAITMGSAAKETRGGLDAILSQLGGLTGSPLPLPGEARAPRRTQAEAPDWTMPEQAPSSAPRTGSRDVGHQAPLPVPGDNVPEMQRRPQRYDDLSDVIRRGGVRIPGGGGGGSGGGAGIPNTGGSLDKVIRDILGGAFGFQNKGILSWVIQYVVMRYGWQIVQFVLRRLMGAR